MNRWTPALACALLALTGGCLRDAGIDGRTTEPGASSAGASAAVETPAPRAADPEGAACRARVADRMRSPAAPGAPAFEANRIEILGRARGEPMVFVREPRPAPDEWLGPAQLASRRAFEASRPGGRVSSLRARHRADPAGLRAVVLREGYVYASDPLDALAMVTHLRLADLFDEPSVWLQRGADVRELRRSAKRSAASEVTYRYADGPWAGRAADLLFGDRVAVDRAGLGAPLHRDLAALADEIGFDRARVLHRGEDALVAELRFGDRWARAVLASEGDGSTLALGCLAEDAPARAAIEAWRAEQEPRLRTMRRLREIVADQVHEALRFDRPEGEEGPDRDGELRPHWLGAYLQGRSGFEVDEKSYRVFDEHGRPSPPQVCVDFVLDTYERTAGTWFRPRGEPLGRVKGRLDFDDAKIPNRRGVLAFGRFAEEQPRMFEVRRFTGPERIPFGERSRFFGFLAEHADEVRAGDVVAIHGLKADERVHQHAILVERTDPLTGFPHGLADQMKRPRRRTWEGIMAEAPKRSLLYRVRPREELIRQVDPG